MQGDFRLPTGIFTPKIFRFRNLEKNMLVKKLNLYHNDQEITIFTVKYNRETIPKTQKKSTVAYKSGY